MSQWSELIAKALSSGSRERLLFATPEEQPGRTAIVAELGLSAYLWSLVEEYISAKARLEMSDREASYRARFSESEEIEVSGTPEAITSKLARAVAEKLQERVRVVSNYLEALRAVADGMEREVQDMEADDAKRQRAQNSGAGNPDAVHGR